MEKVLADRLQRYREQYPEQIRGMAETFCAATTRLGTAGAPVATVDTVRPMAERHGLDVDELVAAITEYAQIEAALQVEALQNFSRGSSLKTSPAPRRWRWWPWR